MGFLARAVAERKAAISMEKLWTQMVLGEVKSKAGPPVTLQTAFRVSASFACMRAISQGCAQVPFKLMQDYKQDGLNRKKVAREHPLYRVISVKPNDWQTSFEFRETMALHASMGNAYAYKVYGRGKLKQLILLDPCRVTPTQDDYWNPVYKVRGRDGDEKTIAASLIWHVRGPSWDGFLGLDMINLIRESLGLSVALEESAAGLHANGVRPTGVYSVEGNLDDKQHDQLTAWLKKHAAAGVGTPLILDRGAKWLQQTMTSIDAQHLEMRQMQIEEVCRHFGVLPIVIGYSGDKANTYASAETMFAAHKWLTLSPWYTRIQESADVNLLTEQEGAEGYYFKFITNGLMHANAKERAEYFAKALGAGGHQPWMAADEVRMLEDLDPFGGEAAQLPPRLGSEPSTQPDEPDAA